MNEIMNTSPPIPSGLKLLFLIIALTAMFSGCATNQDNAQQSNSQTTLSGYIDTGAQGTIK
jgi:uncharacterized lipoprotein YajG